MSLEATLDEENREVLAALDRSKRSSSPMPNIPHRRTATPPLPVRSMLDVDNPTPRHGSIAGIGVGITSPGQSRKPSKLDPSDPSTYTSRHSSKPNSPVLARAEPVSTRQRGFSESDRAVGLPKIQPDDKGVFEQNYQFDIASIPSSAGTRSQTQIKRPRENSSSAMAAAMSGDFSNLYVGLPSKGAERPDATNSGHSRSPSSPSRGADTSTSALLSPASPVGPLMTGSRGLANNHSRRRLSNKSGSFSTVNDDSEEGAGRIRKDGVGEEDVVESSDEGDAMSPSSDEDDTTRGRSERRKYSAGETEAKAAVSSEGETKPTTTAPSVQSLLEPSISITSPSGESVPESKAEEHTSIGASNPPSSMPGGEEEEDEEMAAIQKAKRLAINISPVDSSVPNRDFRVVLRGDWHGHQQEPETGHRASRLYLVCSDLSVEAKYAMEWVVGTMMRDGDTLLAVYAIEDESAGKATEEQKDVLTAEGVQAGKDTADVMETLTRQTTQGGGTSVGLNSHNKYIPATEAESLTGSVDARKVSKKQMERLRAIDSLIEHFLKLVRKTPLEIRCSVEVIHCKSPKHLILGAIDTLEPTVCVVGTRGRSSLKGVLLGSFSNYLVTKSSVPVMVARRRLKKPRSDVKISSNRIRLSNNLIASNFPTKRRSLTQARID
ncbi:hypothetical protein LTR99_010490 [Exophiala xenobiotica]|uniref:UspA domain-containing protein n=1 Tax=Vermiconidia calcicola TaxID=1690605 RepID=A0AAV9PVF5_9PEZI|nr:hypothetical protein LTR41_006650 [Exophiala xenobiotica]KAK5528647.1 hypothetical protein LTR25_010260 [Vermiconidia calcicola]KAK5546071.1 hypothetical protein LTR23_003878 [Chaetothyriales sp. CCFEE 6169]KAK5220631.1 hypothetical protein LTR72_007253 [Exophiala xenobiotica]KAK5290904.1 hypothetical protein LTR14_006411 [Exophiala xenobiotica]